MAPGARGGILASVSITDIQRAGPPRRAGGRGPAARGGLAAAALLTALLAGCSSSDESTTDPPENEPTAQDRLDQARDVLAAAGSVALGLEGSNIPDTGGAVLSADGVGSMEPAAFEGTITARIGGFQADVPVIAVDGNLYVHLPYTPTYVQQSPEQLGVPDPARLFDPDQGVVTLLSITEGAEFGDQTRARDEVLQEIHGTLPGDAVVDLLGVGDRDAAFDVTYGLVEEDSQVRSVALSGPFFPPDTSSYTLTLSDYGLDVDITAP